MVKHSNNSSTTADELFDSVWPFCRVCAYSVIASVIDHITSMSNTLNTSNTFSHLLHIFVTEIISIARKYLINEYNSVLRYCI